VGHHLGLATRTQISVCKSPFPSAVVIEIYQVIEIYKLTFLAYTLVTDFDQIFAAGAGHRLIHGSVHMR